MQNFRPAVFGVPQRAQVTVGSAGRGPRRPARDDPTVARPDAPVPRRRMWLPGRPRRMRER